MSQELFEKFLDKAGYIKIISVLYPNCKQDFEELPEAFNWAIKTERYEIAKIIQEMMVIRFN